MTNLVMYGTIIFLVLAIIWNLYVVLFKRKDNEQNSKEL